MLRLPRSPRLPDVALVRARLTALAGLEPLDEPRNRPHPPDEATTGAGEVVGPRAAAGRALVVVALLAVGAAGWLTWRAQGGDVAPMLVAPGTPVSSAAPAATPSATGSGPDLVVQVLGVVRRPGIVRLPAGARVADAITAAGGLRPGRSSGRLNLARRIVDGEQIIVGPGANTAPPPATTPGGSPAGGPLDLNAADAAALDTLPGVGPVTAQAILDWRGAHGGFASVDQLREVDGIGPKTYERLAPLVAVAGGP